MTRGFSAALLLLPLIFVVACGPADLGPDAGSGDNGVPDAGLDAGLDAGDDAGVTDAGSDAGSDAGASDGGGSDGGSTDGAVLDGGVNPPTPGFGTLSGSCGVLDTEILDPGPSLVGDNHLDFALDPYDPADFGLLSGGGQKIITDGNAGGSSLLSEVFAYEVLYRCEDALLLKTENEVVYTNPAGKITDLLVEIDGEILGVSVTRAIAFPFSDPYPVATAQALLEQKLQGVLDSTANVSAGDTWTKQILHVIAYGPGHADSIVQAFDLVSPTLKADTIVYVTVTDGDDAPLY